MQNGVQLERDDLHHLETCTVDTGGHLHHGRNLRSSPSAEKTIFPAVFNASSAAGKGQPMASKITSVLVGKGSKEKKDGADGFP